MAKESVTVQCYPSDNAVNAKVARYEAFGWELVSNQTFQENEGSGYDIWKGSVTRYSTYNKLTFSREKSEPWYQEVAQLDRICAAKEDDVKSWRSLLPSEPEFHGVVAAFLGVIGIWTLFIPFIIYQCSKSKKKKNYQRALQNWHENYDKKISDAEYEIEQLKNRARMLVNG